MKTALVVDRINNNDSNVHVRTALKRLGYKVHMLPPSQQNRDYFNRYDLIYCCWTDATFRGLSTMRWKGKFIGHVRSGDAYMEGDLIHWKNVDGLAYSAEHVFEALKVPQSIVSQHVGMGINPELWPLTDPDRDYGWTMGLVGRLSLQKNVPFAIALLHELRHTTSKAKLIIRGPQEDPRLENWIKWQANEVSIERVIIDGNWFDGSGMQEFYAGLDYILSPSIHESTHLALLEGMAKGCIPVVQNRPGAACPPTCVYDSMDQCLDVMRYGRSMARTQWREWVEKHRHIDDHIDRLCKFIKEVAA